MAATLIALAALLLTILGVLIRISYQTGLVVQRLDDHMAGSSRVHDDQEARLRRLELGPPRRR